jgi:hypothetical protein
LEPRGKVDPFSVGTQADLARAPSGATQTQFAHGALQAIAL